jgi:hypothetical protein
LENIAFFDKDELVFDIGTAEIIKKGNTYSTLKVKNLIQNKIAIRVNSLKLILDHCSQRPV